MVCQSERFKMKNDLRWETSRRCAKKSPTFFPIIITDQNDFIATDVLTLYI